MNSKLMWAAAAASLLATPLLLAPADLHLTKTVQAQGSQAAKALSGTQQTTIAAQRPASAPAGATKLPAYQADTN